MHSNLQDHIPDNPDDNPVENFNYWKEAEAKAKTAQSTNIGEELKPVHPSRLLVLWLDKKLRNSADQ